MERWAKTAAKPPKTTPEPWTVHSEIETAPLGRTILLQSEFVNPLEPVREHLLEGLGGLADMAFDGRQFDHVLDLDPLAALKILHGRGRVTALKARREATPSRPLPPVMFHCDRPPAAWSLSSLKSHNYIQGGAVGNRRSAEAAPATEPAPISGSREDQGAPEYRLASDP